MPYRYDVSAPPSGKSNCFRPAPLGEDPTLRCCQDCLFIHMGLHDHSRRNCNLSLVGGMPTLVLCSLVSSTWCQETKSRRWCGRHCNLKLLPFNANDMSCSCYDSCFWIGLVCQVITQTGTGTAKLLATKPKLYLTATIVLPPNAWVKISS